jgi:ligand-binding sensor domain-containing protein
MAQAGLLYIGTDNGLVTLSNPGSTGRWRKIGHSLQDHVIHAITVHNPLHLVVHTDTGLQQSLDGGMHWDISPEPPPPRPTSDQQLWVVLPGKQETILALQPDAAGVPTLARSEDGGASWQYPTYISGTGAAGVLPGAVTVLVSVEHHRDSAWAGTDTGHVLYTDTRGQSWQIVAQDMAAICSLAPARLL